MKSIMDCKLIGLFLHSLITFLFISFMTIVHKLTNQIIKKIFATVFLKGYIYIIY